MFTSFLFVPLYPTPSTGLTGLPASLFHRRRPGPETSCLYISLLSLFFYIYTIIISIDVCECVSLARRVCECRILYSHSHYTIVNYGNYKQPGREGLLFLRWRRRLRRQTALSCYLCVVYKILLLLLLSTKTTGLRNFMTRYYHNNNIVITI